MKEKRNIDMEKRIAFVVIVLMIPFLLIALTILIFFVIENITEETIEKNIYYSGILAGGTGALWGLSIQQGFEFYKNSIIGKKWYKTKQSFNNHLTQWLITIIVSFIVIFVIDRFV